MNRYAMEICRAVDDDGDPDDYVQERVSSNGAWVRYEDALEMKTRLEKQIGELTRVNKRILKEMDELVKEMDELVKDK